MKKLSNKILKIFIIGVMLIPTFVPPKVVHAKTLGDLKRELDEIQAELNETKEQQNLTTMERNKIEANIASVQKEIEQTYIDIDNLNKEIENLNIEIAEKEKQMKDVVNFLQVSSGESTYLEYAFGAKDFTDFIYRLAVSEQLTRYNDQLIDEFNAMIEENEKKTKELEQKRVDLTEKSQSLLDDKMKLNQDISALSDQMVSVEDDLEYQKEIIEMYESYGCSDDDDINTCGNKLLPPGTKFYRPTEAGFVISEYGKRYIFGGWGFHEGIDVSVKEGTPVYAVANGRVALVIDEYWCGGNMVLIYHEINGVKYTTVSAHLLSISVQEGDIVDRNTLVGYSGGGSTSESQGGYDECSTGAHLHLTVSLGRYGKDYFSDKQSTAWSKMNFKYSVDPRSVINFPRTWQTYTDRLTAY